MGKRGPKPKGKIMIKWSEDFAYAVGLIATDGCLYNDGRHMSLTTKDEEQANNFQRCLGLKVKNGLKSNGRNKKKDCFHIQFGDVLFYNFLVSIGLSQAKSKTIGAIKIPNKYFFDYLRGCFDGDGTFYSYWDPRWKSSHMFYLEFASASEKHLIWLQKEISKRISVKGHVTGRKKNVFFQLKYAKKEALEIVKKMYYTVDVVCLTRKLIKIRKALRVEERQQNIYARVL